MKMIIVNGKRQKLTEITITAKIWYGNNSGVPYHSVKVWLNDVCLGTVQGSTKDYSYGVTELIKKHYPSLCKSLLSMERQQSSIGTGKLTYSAVPTVRRTMFEKHNIKWCDNCYEVKRMKDL